MAAYESTTVRLDPSKTCVLIEDLLPLYIEGEVSPGSRDMIVEHLAVCERCAGFLAGAQSVRAHLRRGQLPPAQPGPASAAPSAAPSAGRQHPIMMLIGMLGACLLASLGMVFVSHSGDDAAIVTGFGLGIGGFVMLLLIGASAGRWSIVRLLALITTYLAGCIAAILIANAPPELGLGGVVLGIGVLFALWHVLRSGGAALASPPLPAAPRLRFKVNPQLLVLAGLGIVGGLVLLTLPAIYLSLQAPVVLVLLVLAGLIWWKKQPVE